MSWKEEIKKEEYDRDFGGQSDARVTYLNNEFKWDIDMLRDIMRSAPSNVFNNVKKDLRALIDKWDAYVPIEEGDEE